MEIETPGDLSDVIADWLGIYGCCKQETEEGTKPELCKFDPKKPTCCRVGFTNEMTARIFKSVENHNMLYPDPGKTG